MESRLESILKLEVPIVVLIGETELPMSAVLALTPGSIIELPKGSEEELELRVNNMPIGSGIAYKIGENFGIRLSFIGDLRARIAALGPFKAAPHDDAPADAEPEPITDEDAEALADQFEGGEDAEATEAAEAADA